MILMRKYISRFKISRIIKLKQFSLSSIRILKPKFLNSLGHKKRNRLSIETMSAIYLIRSNFHAESINYINFEIDSKHLELYNHLEYFCQNLWQLGVDRFRKFT